MIHKINNRKVTPNNLIKDCAIIFDNYYQEKKSIAYVFSPKDFANLKLLVRKIQQVDNSGNTKESLQVFLQSITSNWHLDNLSIPLINSHFNKLYSDAKQHNELNSPSEKRVGSIYQRYEGNANL